MSTAAKTPNYNLSQVAGPDTPDWITDYTSDMKKIDEALKENADDIATVRPDEFSEESTYAAGDYCIKDNVIYKAKTAVEAGAFDISDWTATTIFDELSGLNQKIPTTMAWDDITGKPNFLSVNSTNITLDNGNNQVTKNISSQMSGYKAVIPVLINTSSGNWNISVGIQGNILIAAGPGVISGYETVVRLYRFK